MSGKNNSHTVSAGALLVTLGIIYGDIGTSPLYVFKAVVGDSPISAEVVFGALSCIFWTLTLVTTIKYVFLTLKADNNGEGGIFSLYALVRRQGRWLLIPAVIGGGALLADGMITPPISVSSAVEGIRNLYPSISTVPIVLCILVGLFSFQNYGTARLGSAFGVLMLVWFLMLGILGLVQIVQHPSILVAFNPYYAYNLLVNHPGGFWLLSGVFLCSTGSEALYSDLGHCGRSNIRITWGFVKTCLLLNYTGQAVWLINRHDELLGADNPFYKIMPNWFLVPGIIIATCAAIIASQALISGSFTLVSEAMRLNIFPKFRVAYPTELKGQIYVPFVNWLLLLGCSGVVLHFRESSNMEGAYGLAITITMLSTTILMGYYLYRRGTPKFFLYLFLVTYFAIEIAYLIANLSKFPHGGYVALLIGVALTLLMLIWNNGSRLNRRYTEYVDFEDYLSVIKALSLDSTVPKFATHLVYLTSAESQNQIDSNVIYSIIRKQPKRADVYWFVHVNVVDEPYTLEYKVVTLVPERVFRIDFYLGFRVEPRINLLFRKVISDMSKSREVDVLSRYTSLRKSAISGDFRFVVLEKFLSYENALATMERWIITGYFLLKRVSLSAEKAFGLDTSGVTVEKVPLVISPLKKFDLKRIPEET